MDLHHALDRIRKAAKEDKGRQFTALWHHVYNVNRLRWAYRALKHEAAPGVDGQTWQDYGKALEENLKELSARLARGAYRAKPVKRVYIPKGDGRLRPIGITALEDKIVQRATTAVLNAVYEADFLGFSYGFRPGRSPHNALDAVTVGIETRKISWVLDADIKGFFDTIDHTWVMRFMEHRIGDRRILRHIKKWLNAGVLEDGAWRNEQEGVPQGGSISPLLANIYLHYTLDRWVEQWRRKQARGEVIIVRYADDFVVGFQHHEEAKRFYEALQARLEQFHLNVSAEKTRLIAFGRFAEERRAERGEGKPETFDFLGFTHICGKTRQGRFCVLRKTMKKKMKAKLKAVKEELRKRMHRSMAEVGRWLDAVLTGHYQYYGVPRNYRSLDGFRRAILRHWRQTLKRRSDTKHRITWERMKQLANRWLPKPRIVHPYPNERLNVITRGRSPVR
jgi:group II intron reverse transcriptase/maturase